MLLVDFRGSGGSTGSETTIGYREAEDAEAAARSLPASSRVILYGKSMGSAAILRAVATGGIEPSALILESPFSSLVDTVGNRFRSMGLPAFPLAHLLVFWGGAQHGYRGFDHAPAAYARSVRCPTLLFAGGRDPRVSRAESEEVFANLAGPKRIVLMPEAGHVPFLTADPEAWRRAVGEVVTPRTGD